MTQRGNARQFLLASDSDRIVYLDLLRRYVQLHPLSLLGYCVMSNHVHLIVVPRKTEALALALKQTHVFGHDHVAHQSEAIAVAHVVQKRDEDVSCANGAQQRQAAVTTEGYEMKMAMAVVANQSFGHGWRKLWDRPPLQTQGWGTPDPELYSAVTYEDVIVTPSARRQIKEYRKGRPPAGKFLQSAALVVRLLCGRPHNNQYVAFVKMRLWA